MKGLGRIAFHDPRNMRFGVGQVVDPTLPLRSKAWDCNLLLDQKMHSTCVGCAWTYELAADPVPVRGLDYLYAAYQIYGWAVDHDVWADNDCKVNPSGFRVPDLNAGSSTLAGAQSCQERGYITSYHWASSVEEIARAIGHHGPVVLGLPWYSSMDRVNSDGFLSVSGTCVGGHDIFARAVNIEKRFFTLKQSWGKGRWEMDGTGDCRLSWDDLERLFHENGEACVPVRRRPLKRKPIYLSEYLR